MLQSLPDVYDPLMTTSPFKGSIEDMRSYIDHIRKMKDMGMLTRDLISRHNELCYVSNCLVPEAFTIANNFKGPFLEFSACQLAPTVPLGLRPMLDNIQAQHPDNFFRLILANDVPVDGQMGSNKMYDAAKVSQENGYALLKLECQDCPGILYGIEEGGLTPHLKSQLHKSRVEKRLTNSA